VITAVNKCKAKFLVLHGIVYSLCNLFSHVADTELEKNCNAMLITTGYSNWMTLLLLFSVCIVSFLYLVYFYCTTA